MSNVVTPTIHFSETNSVLQLSELEMHEVAAVRAAHERVSTSTRTSPAHKKRLEMVGGAKVKSPVVTDPFVVGGLVHMLLLRHVDSHDLITVVLFIPGRRVFELQFTSFRVTLRSFVRSKT